ncbi:hypothetical protein [Burkholderia sp. Ac-20392]|uniref:hypothetical protein n=1 Tax=Burkholderia sp. Ac-20392 TaxID=2703905 RepID=UPI00197DA877|nr:hypothetical protein [Burkholderia sp. Ac-20392]MBN3794654.1 hypothetical protein [Burkholderia sp. Ac-20392]
MRGSRCRRGCPGACLLDHIQRDGLLMNDVSIDEWLAGLERHLAQIPRSGGRYANGRPGFVTALTPQAWRLLNLQGMGKDLATIVTAAWNQAPVRFRALLSAYVRVSTLTALANAPFGPKACFTDPLVALAAGDEATYRVQVPAADDWGDPDETPAVEGMVVLVTKLMAAIEHGLPRPAAWDAFIDRVLAESGAFDRALVGTLLALHAGDSDPVAPFGKVVATFRRSGWARVRYGELAGLPLLPVGIVALARRKRAVASDALAAMLPAAAASYSRVLAEDAPACPFRFRGELAFLNELLADPASWAALAAQLARQWNATA